jgi:hypothetical protein
MKVQMVWLNNSQASLIRINENRKETPTIGGEREREREREAHMNIHAHTNCKSDGTPSSTSILVEKYFTYQKERSNKLPNSFSPRPSLFLCLSVCLSMSLCVDLSVCVMCVTLSVCLCVSDPASVSLSLE